MRKEFGPSKLLSTILLLSALLFSSACSPDDSADESSRNREAVATYLEIQANRAAEDRQSCEDRGYDKYYDGVCFRFMKKSDPAHDCGYSRGSCSVLEVSPIRGCNSLYVRANVLDANENIIDWTNGTAGGVPAEGNAIIKLSTFESRASSIQLTEINCR